MRADFGSFEIAQAYKGSSAACLSVLTDQKFFQGSFDNLRVIRQVESSTSQSCCKQTSNIFILSKEKNLHFLVLSKLLTYFAKSDL
ncbi:MAG: hypothetical protein KME38_25105 [Spirirestis rafaelensis WJT71-NPBG6]|nr:hypothetical protein [Spirirestis rafaelensis WJT71-NPBG6]